MKYLTDGLRIICPKQKNNMKEKFDIYELVNKRIIEMLEAGTVPWHQPWRGGEPPANLISKKPYRGINPLLLGCQAFTSRYWLTFNQAKGIGGMVRKGEQSTVIVFWKFLEVADKETGEPKTIPMLRYYRVFNVEQCDNIDPKKIPACDVIEERDLDPIASCEVVAKHYMDNGPSLGFDAPRAYYTPSTDSINMPALPTFDSAPEYYATLFHEMIHSTGHHARLNRIKATAHFSSAYSKEELCAEYGSAYLCALRGIENTTIDNSAAYINSWLTKLKNDKKLLVSACGQAQRAVDRVLE